MASMRSLDGILHQKKNTRGKTAEKSQAESQRAVNGNIR